MDLFNTAPRRVPTGACWGCEVLTYKGEPHFCKPRPAARATDPATSHEAARKVEKSGRAQTNRARCLDAVKAQPGATSGEIAKAAGLERHEAARRLPELRDKLGMVKNEGQRKCKVTGNPSIQWWAVIPPFVDPMGRVE